MKRDPSRKLDAATMVALAKARERKDRRAVSYLIAVGIVVLVLGLIYWLMRPGEPDHFHLAAYDAVASPGEEVQLYARLEPVGAASAMREKHEIRFQIKETQTDEQRETVPGARAAIQWKAPKDKSQVVEFMVRHQHTNNAKNVDRDQGRAFIWPKDSKLLVVDVDHALTEGVEGLAGNTAPVLRPGAAATLRTLAPKYKIVYISPGANTPSRYKKLRSWLGQQVPPGPLLGPASPVDSADLDAFGIEQMELVKKLFSGPAISVAGRKYEAQKALDLGWKAVVIGEVEDLPAAATSIATWSEFPKD